MLDVGFFGPQISVGEDRDLRKTKKQSWGCKVWGVGSNQSLVDRDENLHGQSFLLASNKQDGVVDLDCVRQRKVSEKEVLPYAWMPVFSILSLADVILPGEHRGQYLGLLASLTHPGSQYILSKCFLHLLRQLCNFCFYLYICDILHALIYTWWTILPFLQWSLLSHDVCFKLFAAFHLLVSCWEFSHLSYLLKDRSIVFNLFESLSGFEIKVKPASKRKFGNTSSSLSISLRG